MIEDMEFVKWLNQLNEFGFDMPRAQIPFNSFNNLMDLPQAKGAIFYSPKASETSTFQEASRIRSTTANVKTCYILCYGGTDEREKLTRLIQQIKLRSDRDYRISDPCRLWIAGNGDVAQTKQIQLS